MERLTLDAVLSHVVLHLLLCLSTVPNYIFRREEKVVRQVSIFFKFFFFTERKIHDLKFYAFHVRPPLSLNIGKRSDVPRIFSRNSCIDSDRQSRIPLCPCSSPVKNSILLESGIQKYSIGGIQILMQRVLKSTKGLGNFLGGPHEFLWYSY